MIRIGEAYAMDMGDLGKITAQVVKLEEDNKLLSKNLLRYIDQFGLSISDLEAKVAAHVDCPEPTVEAEPIRDLQGGIRISAKLYDSLIADRRRLEWLISSSGTQLWDITGRSYRTRGEIDRMMKAGE